MADYKLYKDMNNVNEVGVIYKGKKWIPFDEGNRDYQDYKLWLDAGNTPAAADQTVYKLTNRT